VTKPETPRFLFSVAEGENWYGEGHTITATPDGRYAILAAHVLRPRRRHRGEDDSGRSPNRRVDRRLA
jgi:hypothetical protein